MSTMIEKKRPLNNFSNLNGIEILCLGSDAKAILKPSSEAKTVSELKVALEKIWDNFPQVQLVKLSKVLQVVWQE